MPDIYPGQEHFVAPVEETPLLAVDSLDTTTPPTSQWKDAWKSLRSNPVFLVSAVMLIVLAFVLAFPGVITGVSPTKANLGDSLAGPRHGHPLGFDKQGYDVLSRTLHGARASVAVGVLTTILVAVLGSVAGSLAGFYGGWVDSVISRIADIFFAIPLLLAAVVVLSVVNNVAPDRGFWLSVGVIVFAFGAFGWPQICRIMRGAVLEIKNSEFIDAATAIGATRRRNLIRHIVPNALAPVIVVSTVSLGIFIVAEATVSFLGIGLPENVVSWGSDISQAQSLVRSGQHLSVMFWPAGALALTVLSFILLGDAVRDALDPKARKQ